MARLYADEHVPSNLVDLLRDLGHDLLTVEEAGQAGGDDAQVLVDATAASRAVLTFNRWDFERLHQKSKAHSGIVSCTPDEDVHDLAGRVHDTVSAAGLLVGLHIRVNRPNQP